MSYRRGRLRWGALGVAGLLAVAAPVLALALPDLPALPQLERGRWQLKQGPDGTARSLCVAAAADFVQLEHPGIDCGQEVLASRPGAATIQYTCPGHGFGHTSIRVETPRLARIDTQGLIDGRPFSYRAEARRVGAC
jgi:hypothetical protein